MRDGCVKEGLMCMQSIFEKWWHSVREGNTMRPAFLLLCVVMVAE